MSKLTILGIAAVIAALVIGGALEVRFHPDKVAHVPGKVAGVVQDKATQEWVRTKAVAVKRYGESLLIRDPEKQLEIATKYVEADANRLQEVLADATAPQAILPQASLVADSVMRLQEAQGAVSTDTKAAYEKEAEAALAVAREAVDELQTRRDEYEALQNQFASLVETLTSSLGNASEAGDVAGATTDQSAE